MIGGDLHPPRQPPDRQRGPCGVNVVNPVHITPDAIAAVDHHAPALAWRSSPRRADRPSRRKTSPMALRPSGRGTSGPAGRNASRSGQARWVDEMHLSPRPPAEVRRKPMIRARSIPPSGVKSAETRSQRWFNGDSRIRVRARQSGSARPPWYVPERNAAHRRCLARICPAAGPSPRIGRASLHLGRADEPRRRHPRARAQHSPTRSRSARVVGRRSCTTAVPGKAPPSPCLAGWSRRRDRAGSRCRRPEDVSAGRAQRQLPLSRRPRETLQVNLQANAGPFRPIETQADPPGFARPAARPLLSQGADTSSR